MIGLCIAGLAIGLALVYSSFQIAIALRDIQAELQLTRNVSPEVQPGVAPEPKDDTPTMTRHPRIVVGVKMGNGKYFRFNRPLPKSIVDKIKEEDRIYESDDE